MSRDPKYDILFEPVRLGPKETPNRFYQAPYAIGVGCESPAAQAAFRAIRAEGGWGVVGTGYCSIHPESDDAPRLHVHLWNEDDVRALALLCDAVHEHGALASVELHYGPGSGYGTRLPVRETAIGKDEISELEALYAVAARGAQAAGFDVVNVHGAELSAITSQFIGAATNSRTDEYGGTLATGSGPPSLQRNRHVLVSNVEHEGSAPARGCQSFRPWRCPS